MKPKIIPVSKARGKLGSLVQDVNSAKDFDSKAIYLTKDGEARAVLLDIDYYEKMKEDTDIIYGRKTFIDKETLPYIRDFTDEEIADWLEEDKL